jgi:hypothetical protein
VITNQMTYRKVMAELGWKEIGGYRRILGGLAGRPTIPPKVRFQSLRIVLTLNEQCINATGYLNTTGNII